MDPSLQTDSFKYRYPDISTSLLLFEVVILVNFQDEMRLSEESRQLLKIMETHRLSSTTIQEYYFISMDILKFGCCSIFSCSLIKRNSWRAKITIFTSNPFTPPPLTTGWTNWTIKELHVSNLNWRLFFPLSWYPCMSSIH